MLFSENTIARASKVEIIYGTGAVCVICAYDAAFNKLQTTRQNMVSTRVVQASFENNMISMVYLARKVVSWSSQVHVPCSGTYCGVGKD